MIGDIKRCVIYARKSFEDNKLEFNSLHAQRQICLSYIKSQKPIGWMPLGELYNDNGFSGSDMERPALNQLIEGVKARKFDIIVVYKIDRLTRSLLDFAKLIQILDEYDVTFVSVTQSFNTTTPVGRLTLNILLSFAQFERETIRERIRDKIEASRKNGFWTGATPPLGYDVINGKLEINDSEANVIKEIFKKYIDLKNTRLLADYFKESGVVGKATGNGKTKDGKTIGQAGLRSILRNPIHVGKVRHNGVIYEGKHNPIINLETWSRAQQILKDRYRKKCESQYLPTPSLLRKKLFSCTGEVYRYTHAVHSGRVYLYYVSPKIRKSSNHPYYSIGRFPVNELDKLVVNAIERILLGGSNRLGLVLEKEDNNQILLACFKDDFSRIITKIILHLDKIEIHLSRLAILSNLPSNVTESIPPPVGDVLIECVPYYRSKHNMRLFLRSEDFLESIFDRSRHNLKSLICGIVWRDEHFNGTSIKEIADREKLSKTTVRRFIYRSIDLSYINQLQSAES